MSVQRLPDTPPYHPGAHGTYRPEAHVRVRGAYTAPDGAPAGPERPDEVLRASEPISAELGGFILRQLASAWNDANERPSAVYPLATLLDGGQPWPVHLAVHLLRRIADVLDAADAAGLVFGALFPRCITFDGPYLVLAPAADFVEAESAYVAPEQREPGGHVDARASQYGLALLASILLANGRRPADLAGPHAGLRPAVQRLVLTARHHDPERRFSHAGDFVTALEAACAESWPSEPDGAVAQDAVRPNASRARLDGTSAFARRFAVVGALVGVAALAGAAAGWYVGRRPSTAALATSTTPVSARVAAAPSAGAVPVRTSALAAAGGEVVAGDVAVAGPSTASPALRPDTLPPPVGRVAPRAARDRAGPLSALPVGALASAVVLPGVNSVIPPTRRPVSSPAEFAAGGLTGPQGAGNERAETADVAPSSAGAATAMTRAELVAGASPRYPTTLQEARVEGEVVARFVVDGDGRVDPGSMAVVRSDHPLFEQAVRESLRQARYRPAERGGRRVPATIEQTFRFALPR